MPEFKIKCWYKLNDRQQIWNDKDPQIYHRFFVANFRELPSEFFASQEGICSLWIADCIVKDIKTNFKLGDYYQFVIKLGEPNTAHFKHKYGIKGGKKWDNNMILKTKDYFENTVQKIGFWDSEDYFYEAKKKPEKPVRNQNNRPTQPENKSDWGKIALVCLPIIIVAFFSFLIIKWVSKKKKQ